MSWQEEYFCVNMDPDSKVPFQCCINTQMNVNEVLRWKAMFIIQKRRWNWGQNPDQLLLPHWICCWCVWNVYLCVLTSIKMRRALLGGIVPLSVCKRMHVTTKTNTNRFNKYSYLINCWEKMHSSRWHRFYLLKCIEIHKIINYI